MYDAQELKTWGGEWRVGTTRDGSYIVIAPPNNVGDTSMTPDDAIELARVLRSAVQYADCRASEDT